MKHIYCLILCVLLCVCISFSGCQQNSNKIQTPVAEKSGNPEVKPAPRPEFAEKDDRIFEPDNPVTCDGLDSSQLTFTVHSGKLYNNIDKFPLERFSHEAKMYTTDRKINSPYVFVTAEISVTAVKGSTAFGDGYYMDVLRLVDLNKSEEFGTLSYYDVVSGDIRLSDEEKDYNLFRLEEGKSGKIIAGFFIKEECTESEELYISIGLSKENCFYVPLKDLILGE